MNGEPTNWFELLVGVLRGCIMFPLLFNILLEVVMALATTEVEFGTFIPEHGISNLRFSANIDLLAETEPDLQSLVTSVDITSSRFGLQEAAPKLKCSKSVEYLNH